MPDIPLPALDVRPPQAPPNQLEQLGQMLQLKNAMQNAPLQNQALQQQVQAGGMENQQKQIQLQDQQAVTKAMQQWDGKDLNALPTLVLKNGGSGMAVMGLKQKQLALQGQYSKIAADDATTGAKNLETMKGKNDMIAGVLSTVMQTPDAELPQALTSTAQDLVQKGLLDPQHAQAAAQLAQSGNPAQIRQQLDLMRKSFLGQTQLMDMAQKKAQTREATSRAHEADVNSSLAPLIEKSRLAFQEAQLRLSQQRNGMEGQRLALQQQQLGVSPNGGPSDLAQAIASGHVSPERLGYLLTRNPGLIQGVMQADPSFDSSKAAAYPQVYKDFTSSKPNTAGGSLLAGSTALQHLEELKALNTPESHIPGTSAYNAYQNKADTVAGELARFYGTDTVPGIENIKKTLTATLPGNRDAAILTQAQSMGDRLDNYEQTWRNAAPSRSYEAPMPGISAAANAARAALDPAYAARLRSGAKPGQPNAGAGANPSAGGNFFSQFGGVAH